MDAIVPPVPITATRGLVIVLPLAMVLAVQQRVGCGAAPPATGSDSRAGSRPYSAQRRRDSCPSDRTNTRQTRTRENRRAPSLTLKHRGSRLDGDREKCLQ